MIHTFVNTDQDMDEWTSFMNAVHNHGAVNLLTLETSGYNTVEIQNGALDSYFTNLAKQMKSWQGGKEINLLVFHEFNGNWYEWSIGGSSINTNASFKAAWQRMVNIFRTNGATNVKFVYNVNWNNNGSGASFMGAYPGDNYVDFVSIDGYNWGTSSSWSNWMSFRDIFKDAYNALTAGSNKPVIIAEFACSEQGGNKAAWINDMQAQIANKTFPELYAATWFNQDKETDWRVESSSASLAAYK
jgi:endoglucanase